MELSGVGEHEPVHLDLRLQVVAILKALGLDARAEREIEALRRAFPADPRLMRLR